MTSLLEVRDLVMERGGKQVLFIDELSITQGETLTIIGPNGAGKSTLLLALSRLLKPLSGEILYKGKPLEEEDELRYRRRIALVLQEALLLDTTVFNNVATGLRYRRTSRQETKLVVEEWLSRLGVADLKNRQARGLSGGESQRVSLARAFALKPELLLLDEPFSSLDAPTRKRLLEDFHNLLVETDITTVFVTHDLDEALLLGDRAAVLLEGKLRQSGLPEQVFSAPVDRQVAEFVGVETVVQGTVLAEQSGMLQIEVCGLRLEAVGEAAAGQQVMLCLRPEDITLFQTKKISPGGQNPGIETAASSARNRIPGIIQQITPQGPLARVKVDCGFPLVALVTRNSLQELGFNVGNKIEASFKASAVHMIPR